MKGIDGTHALSKFGRAQLCDKRKKLTDKDSSLTADENTFIRKNAALFGFNQPRFAGVFS